MSVHGRKQNLIGAVKRNRKVFALVGEKDGIAKICDKLLSYGMDEVKIYVGERLSYPEEQITEGTPESLKGQLFDPLSVVLLVNETPEKLTTHGLSDDVFLRAKVPMTKQGIRSISLSKLALEEDSICWDVGAGTGSVSVEMARQCPKGEVWAIEKKDEAVELLEENRRKFALDNLTIVPGLAPEALKELPAPTHVFIGGSSGSTAGGIKTVTFGILMLTAVSVLGLVLAPQIIAVFRNDPEVIAFGARALRLQCLAFPLCGVIVISSMLTQTINKVWQASVLAVARQGLFFIPAVLALPHIWGELGVQLAQPVSDVCAFALTVPRGLGVLRDMDRQQRLEKIR